MDKVKAILDDSSGTQLENTFNENYNYLKSLLIQAKQEREGRFNINFIEAHDMAFEMARQLPSGVVLASDDGPDDPEPNEPGWMKSIALCMLILGIELLAYYLLYV